MVLPVPVQVAIRTHVLVHADILEQTARLLPVHAQTPHVRTEEAALLLVATRIRVLAHVVIQEQIVKTQVFDLISNVGGTLGLFIGLSFFTFVELICFD